MKAEAINPSTGEKLTAELSDEQFEQLDELKKDYVSDSRLDELLDRLDLSADAKAMIASLRDAAVKVGGILIRVGKKIIEISLMLATKYPNTTFGLILSVLVALLIGSIPLIGGLLGSVLLPLAAAFGLAMGFKEDLQDHALERKIKEAMTTFDPLKGTA